MAKKITVKDILDLSDEQSEINIIFYAYGQYYGSTANDNLDTVGDIKRNLRYDLLKAKITEMRVVKFDNIEPFLRIKAEIVN